MTYPAADLELLWRVAFGRCRAAGASVEDAQDCAQDAITELLAHPEVERPKAWVATVAHHRYIDLCRLRRKEGTVGLVPTSATLLSEPTGPEEEVVSRVHARWLVGLMGRWPLATRAVCSAVGAGLSRPEIGHRLGLTNRAVESHLTRARRLLRALSLLGIPVVFALGRVVRRMAPTGKPVATAAVLAPSIAAVLVIGGGQLDDEAGPGRLPPRAIQPPPIGHQDPAQPVPRRDPQPGLDADRPAGETPPPAAPPSTAVQTPGELATTVRLDAPMLPVPQLPKLSVSLQLPVVLPAIPELLAGVSSGQPALSEVPGLPPLPTLPPLPVLPEATQLPPFPVLPSPAP